MSEAPTEPERHTPGREPDIFWSTGRHEDKTDHTLVSNASLLSFEQHEASSSVPRESELSLTQHAVWQDEGSTDTAGNSQYQGRKSMGQHSQFSQAQELPGEEVTSYPVYPVESK